MLNIFLSSTYRDLKDSRREILNKLDSVFEGVGMEKFIPDGETSHKKCIQDLKKSDIVIFLLSSNYGTLIEVCELKENCKAECPMKTGEGQISYTHCEYKTTISEGILHQTYFIKKEWDAFDVKKEITQFKEEIGKENLGLVNIEDPDLLQIICVNLAKKIVKWHTQDRLNFKRFIDREKALNEIIDNINDKIEVWGVGGVGKTALIEVALLVEKLKGRKIVTIGTTKTYKSGSGFKDFSDKCAEDQYMSDSKKEITIHDVVKALEKVKLIPNAKELISSLQQKDKIKNFLSKFINESENLIIFIDDFHLATKKVKELVNSLEKIILSSRKKSYIATKDICIIGIDEKDREDLINLFSAKEIPENAKKMIKTVAEGHPVATELIVKNYEKIDFDKIKGFELIDADDNQVKDFYERVIEEIFSNNPKALTLLKNLAVLNIDLPTNINKESMLHAYDIENVRNIFNSLVDAGMLKKREGQEGIYEFYFKHIQDILEDNVIQEDHKKAIEYYQKKREIIGESIDDEVEVLSHEVKLNLSEELVDEFLKIKDKIQPIHYGFKRLIDIGEELSILVEEKNKASIFAVLGNFYYNLGRFEEAEHAYQEALNIYKELADKNPGLYALDVVITQNNQGKLFSELGRFEEAEHAYEEALNIVIKLVNKNPDVYNPKVAVTQNNLGNLYRILGRFEEAERAHQEALEIRKELADKNPDLYNSEVAVTQNNLGALYINLRQFEEAEHAFIEALEIRKELADKNPDAHYPNIALIQSNLGVLYADLGRFEEAERTYQEALKIRKNLVDKNPDAYYPDIALTQSNLGNLFRNLERFEEAEHAYKEALEIRKELADKNPDVYKTEVAGTQNNLGDLFRILERFEDAEHALQESLKIYKELADKNLDVYNPKVAVIKSNLGVLYHDLGRFEEAEHAYEEALNIVIKLVNKNPDVYNPKVAVTQNNLGNLYRILGRFEEAEHALQESLKIYKELTDKNPDVYNPKVAVIKSNLGALYYDLGRFEEAEYTFQESLKIYRTLANKNPDVYNPNVAKMKNNLGSLFRNLEQFEESEHALQESLKIYKELTDKNPDAYNPKVAAIKSNLGALYYDLGRFEEAEHAFQDSLKIYRTLANKNPDVYNPIVAKMKNNLELIHSKLNFRDKKKVSE